MDDKPFSSAVRVKTARDEVIVTTTRQALELLTNPGWPVRGPRHRDATDACLKVLEGYRSTQDARKAFVEAVAEALSGR